MTNKCNIALAAKEEEIPRAMEFIEEIMARASFSPGKVLEVQLAVEEALMNIMHHSYSECNGEINLTSETHGDCLVVILEDEGARFDPTKADGPKLSDNVEEMPIGGLGIHLIKSFVKAVRYEFKDGKNTLILIIRRD
jgi:serine/threonine-protein kinase RsbW